MSRLTTLALLAALFGCAEDERPEPYVPGTLKAAATFPGTPGDPDDFERWFEQPKASEDDCPPVPGAPLAGLERTLRVFYHPDTKKKVPEFLGKMRRFFDRYGLKLVLRHAPIAIPVDWLYETDPDRVERTLEVDWPTAQPSNPAFEADRLYAENPPLYDLIDVYGRGGAGVVNVVFLPRMERRPGGAAGSGYIFIGDHITADPRPADPPFGPVSYPATPTPTMFLNVRYIKRSINLGASDLIIDHRMASGFAHAHGVPGAVEDDGTITPALFDGNTSSCARDFSVEQLTLLKAALEAAPSP